MLKMVSCDVPLYITDVGSFVEDVEEVWRDGMYIGTVWYHGAVWGYSFVYSGKQMNIHKFGDIVTAVWELVLMHEVAENF